MILDQEILSEIQRVSLENAGDAGVSWPSGMWTLVEVLGYLNQRQNRFLAETGLYWNVQQTPILPGVAAQIRPVDWIARVQTAYKSGAGSYVLLEATDLRQLDLSHPDWPGTSTLDVPFGCYEVEGETQTDYLAPIPLDPDAALERYYVAMGEVLTQDGIAFSVGDEFVPTIKYGALADMFNKVGPAASPVLAEMCEQRWQEGIELGKLMSTEGWMVG